MIRFSDRTSWHRAQNRLAEELERLRREGRDVIDLTCSNPTEAGVAYPGDVILRGLAGPEALRYAPDPKGLPGARAAVAAHYAARGVRIDPASILLTASTSESYSYLFRLLCNSGERILVPAPSYPLFDYLAQINDVRTDHYALRYDGRWYLDMASIENAATPETRALVVVHPHNPTGMLVSPPERARLIDFCRSRGVALIVDEVFLDYAFDPAAAESFAATSGILTCTLNGLSKMAGLPQLKLGWIAVSGPREERAEALARLEILADTFLSVNTPAQVALPAILAGAGATTRSIRERVRRNYEAMRSACAGTVCSALESDGGWYGILRIPRVLPEEEVAVRLLREHAIALYPGYFFDMTGEGFLVVSLLPREEVFAAAVETAAQAVSRLTSQ